MADVVAFDLDKQLEVLARRASEQQWFGVAEAIHRAREKLMNHLPGQGYVPTGHLPPA